MKLTVEDVMVEDVVTISADATVLQAAKLMNKNEIGCLIVLRRERAVGIVTERDLLKRIVSESRDPMKTKVRQIMTKPLIAGEPEMDVEDATRLMFDNKIKKLPVLEDGKLVGLVTLTDLVRYQPQMIRILKEIATRHFTPPKRMQKVIDYYVI